MSDAAQFANPFHIWAGLVHGLRTRFIAELGDERRTPYGYSLLGGLAGLAKQCENMRTLLDDLARHDQKTFEAFLRAERTL